MSLQVRGRGNIGSLPQFWGFEELSENFWSEKNLSKNAEFLLSHHDAADTERLRLQCKFHSFSVRMCELRRHAQQLAVS